MTSQTDRLQAVQIVGSENWGHGAQSGRIRVCAENNVHTRRLDTAWQYQRKQDNVLDSIPHPSIIIYTLETPHLCEIPDLSPHTFGRCNTRYTQTRRYFTQARNLPVARFRQI